MMSLITTQHSEFSKTTNGKFTVDKHVNTKKRNEEYRPFSEESFIPPSFTIKELRDAIPEHLFQKSLLKSSAYLARTLAGCAGLFYLATFIDDLLPLPLRLIAWPSYWLFEGIVIGGLWTLAHECGHRAFCNSKTINDVIGFILHSSVLVPYHSFRITHAQHHAGNANLKTDSVFLPNRRNVLEKSALWRATVQDTPLGTFLVAFVFLLLGWPLYFILNMKGYPDPKFTSQVWPSSPFYKKHQWNLVFLSNVGVLLVLSGLGYWAYLTSVFTVIKYYVIPYLVVNAWITCFSVLQHTDSYVPHYSPEAWTFVRGAVCTVDRDYGWFINNAFYHVGDAHVVHHIFSTIPHYNMVKATPYLKEKLGKYYLFDKTPIFTALMKSFRECGFVEDEGSILFFKNKL